MSNVSYTLLPNTSNDLNKTGNKIPAAGYYGYKTGLHTVSISCNDFTGRIYIQATLSSNPEENDWFNIEIESNDYLEKTDVTGTFTYNFQGNFVYVRAKLDRTYLDPQPNTVSDVGLIKYVLLHY